MPQRHRPELSESVSADPLGTYRRTPRTFRPGRRCAVPGCLTVLSIYNGAKHCAAHNPKQSTMARTRTSSDTTVGPPPAVAKEDHVATTVRAGGRILVERGGDVSRRAS
jgi:hypothetical protein